MNMGLLFFGVAIIYIYMAIHTLSRRIQDQRNRIHFAISITFAFWALVNGVMFLITDPVIAANTRKFMAFSWGTVYSMILHLILILSGRVDRWKKKIPVIALYLMIYLPAAMNILLYFANPYAPDQLLRTNNGWIIVDYFGKGFLWDYYFYFYYVLNMTLCLIILLRWNMRTRQLREKKQSRIMLWSFSVAFLAGSILEIIIPLLGVSLVFGITMFIALIPMISMWFAIERYGLMNFDPALLAPNMLEMMNEGLIICDTKGLIKSMNIGAKRMLAYNFKDKVEHVEDIGILSDYFKEISQLENVSLVSKDGMIVPVILNSMNLYDSVNQHYGYMIVFQDISSLKKAQDKLSMMNNELEQKVEERTQSIKQLAYFDHLTELPNFRSFTEEFAQRVSSERKKRFVVLFMDIDDFKSINDTLGHSIGDELLIHLANRFKDACCEGGFVARNGGDEFIFLIDEAVDGEGFDEHISHVLDVFDQPFELGNHTLKVSCSVGASIYPDHAEDSEHLIRYADIAMYRAKAHGLSTFAIFTNSMKDGLKLELELTNDLHFALERDELILHYQPQIDYDTGKVTGIEALIRWQHPQKGLLSPNKFIPIAETTGLIEPIGDWIIENAMATYQVLKEEGFDLKVSINLSVNQLKTGKFLRTVRNTALAKQIDMGFMEFEVTENLILDQSPQSLQSLETLASMGSSIALDDFGVEYSSLNYIKLLPINVLKIDKTFIDGIGISKHDEAIVKTIITLANNLGYEVIAEGVEEEHQLEFLKANECTLIQGYYYSKALKIEELFTYLVKDHKTELKER